MRSPEAFGGRANLGTQGAQHGGQSGGWTYGGQYADQSGHQMTANYSGQALTGTSSGGRYLFRQ